MRGASAGARGRWACGVAVATAVFLAAASVATAQTPVPTTSSSSVRKMDIGFGVSFLPAVPMGSRNIAYTAPNGSPYVLAGTSSRTATSFGLETRIGLRLRERVSFEMAGAWTRVRFQTSVTADTEGASPLAATIGASRFAVGGAILFNLTSPGRREIFTLAEASWIREISQLSTSALYDDGAIVDGGVGVKLWFRERDRGRVKRVGLRIEGRVGVRTGGLTLDTKSTHVVSSFVGSLIIGS